MTVGHLGIATIGYLLLRRRSEASLGAVFAFGSLMPDIDLLWWYVVGHGQTAHHLYWTHLPSFWLLVGSVVAVIAWLVDRHFLRPLGVFLLAILIHLIVDTHAGGICWLHPFNDRMFYLFAVPNIHGNFVVSALLHWTFLLELPFVVAALWLLKKDGLPRWSELR